MNFIQHLLRSLYLLSILHKPENVIFSSLLVCDEDGSLSVLVPEAGRLFSLNTTLGSFGVTGSSSSEDTEMSIDISQSRYFGFLYIFLFSCTLDVLSSLEENSVVTVSLPFSFSRQFNFVFAFKNESKKKLSVRKLCTYRHKKYSYLLKR